MGSTTREELMPSMFQTCEYHGEELKFSQDFLFYGKSENINLKEVRFLLL